MKFASDVGVDSTVLTNVEHGRTPLRFALADQICRRFNVNQRWVATGQLPRTGYFPLSREEESQISPRAVFSVAFDDYLRTGIEVGLAMNAKITGCTVEELEGAFTSDGADDGERIAQFITWRARIMPAKLREDFLNTVLSAAETFVGANEEEIRRLKGAAKIEYLIGPVSKGLPLKRRAPQPPKPRDKNRPPIRSPRNADKHKG